MKYQMLSPHDKLKIIEEAKYNGVIATCQKYGISHVNYYNWLKKIEKSEEQALKTKRSRSNKELYNLLEENRRLRKIVEEKELIIEKLEALLQSNIDDTKRSKKTSLKISS